MADIYIKQANGGETTTPTGDEGLPLDDGATSTWIAIKNLIIRKLRETSGPTTLSMGAVADGEYLKRDGSNIIGATVAGGGGLTNSIASVTTSNVTGVVGTRHILDVSGLTANRNFVLPAGAVDDEIELVISTGDDTYHLIAIGDTGITINGGSAATEWDRTQAKNDRVRFVATSTSNWQTIGEFESRKALPSFEANQTTAHSVTTGTDTPVICNNETKDTGGYYDTSNGKFTPLVAGTYLFHGTAAINNIADGKDVWVGFRKNGTTVRWIGITNSSFANADPGAGGAQRFYLDGVDDYVEMIIWHNHGSSLNTYDGGNDNICHFGGHRISPFDICGI